MGSYLNSPLHSHTVSAAPMISLPSMRAGGMEEHWMAVGSEKLRSRSAMTTGAGTPSSSQLLMSTSEWGGQLNGTVLKVKHTYVEKDTLLQTTHHTCYLN